jgi:hypothetical protein
MGVLMVSRGRMNRDGHVSFTANDDSLTINFHVYAIQSSRLNSS